MHAGMHAVQSVIRFSSESWPAKLLAMDFQVRHRAARLTTPAIAAQDLLPKTLV
jgi:hypothetical protein